LLAAYSVILNLIQNLVWRETDPETSSG